MLSIWGLLGTIMLAGAIDGVIIGAFILFGPQAVGLLIGASM
jgi:hypothetical protein